MPNNYINPFNNTNNTVGIGAMASATSVNAIDNSNASIMANNSSSTMNYVLSPSDLKEDDIELIKKELERKIQEQKDDLENAKNTRGWPTSLGNGFIGIFGGGDKKVEKKIVNYEALLASLDSDISNIDEVYKTIMGSDLDLASLQSLKGSEALASSIDSETQEAIVAELENQLAALESNFEATKNSNGWISGSWNWFKNWTGLGASSNKTTAEINDLKEQIEKLKNGEADLATTFKNITGTDLNIDNLSSLLSGEEGTGLDSISTAGQSVNAYSEGQKMCTDVVGDMVSGIASVGVVVFGTAIGICAAPFTAGASLGMVAAGIGLAAGTGAIVKTAIKASDCIGNEKEYSLKDAGYDIVTGSLNGAAAPSTNALGGAAGTTVMKICGQEALETTVKSGALLAAKSAGKEILEEGVEQAGKKVVSFGLAKVASFGANSMVDGGLSGFIDGSSRALAEGRYEDIFSDGIDGLKGGLIAAPIMGAGFSLAGKAGSKLGQTALGQAAGKALKEGAQVLGGAIDNVLPQGVKRIVQEGSEKLNKKFIKTSLKNCLTISDDGIYSVKTNGYSVQLIEDELSEEILEAITRGDNTLVFNYANEVLMQELTKEAAQKSVATRIKKLSKKVDKEIRFALNAQNITLAEKLCSDPDFPKEMIANVLGCNNAQNCQSKMDMFDFLKENDIVKNSDLPKEMIARVLCYTDAQNISLAEKLCSDPDFPKDEIVDVVLRTNAQNISLAEKLYSDPDFPKEMITSVLSWTKDYNIGLAEKLYSDPDFPKEKIVDVLRYTNEQNITLAEKLYSDPDFSKEKIVDVLRCTNEQNITLAEKLYSDPDFPKEMIANVLGCTNAQNITLAEKLCSDPDFPKEMIANVLGCNNAQNCQSKMDMFDFLKENDIVKNSDLPKEMIARVLCYTDAQNISLAKKLYSETDFPKEKIVDVLRCTNAQNISLAEKLYFDLDFPKDKIVDVVLRTDAQNITLAEKLCSEPDFPKEMIANVLGCTDAQNITLAEKLCSEPDFPKEMIANVLGCTNAQNITLAKKLCSEPDFPKEEIANVLGYTDAQNITLAEKLCSEPDFPKEEIASVLGYTDAQNCQSKMDMFDFLKEQEDLSDDVIVKVLSFWTTEIKQVLPDIKNKDVFSKIAMDKSLRVEAKELLLCRFLNIIDDIEFSKLTLREKMKQINILKEAQSCDIFTDEERNFLNIDNEIIELQESIKKVIATTSTSKEATQKMMSGFFANNNPQLDNLLSTTDFTQFGKNGLPLEYPRQTFISDLSETIKDLPETEQADVLKKLGITLANNEGTIRYDGIIDLTKLSQEGVEGDVLFLATKFIKENSISTGDSELDEALNSLIQGMPEFINIIGKQQHGTQDFSVDIHMLTVLKEAMSNPNYQNLSNQDKFCLKFATILHDIAKSEGVVDDGHAELCALYARDILNKDTISLSVEIKDRIYELVKNHHWLEDYNAGKINSDNVAALYRRTGDLQIAQIMAEADLKGVKADGSFYDSYGKALNDDMQIPVQNALTTINSQGQMFLTNKIIDSSKIPTVLHNGTEYQVINFTQLAKNTDLQQYGFEPGATVDNLRLMIHMVKENNIQGLENVYTLNDPSYEGYLCATFASIENHPTYSHYKFGVSLESEQVNIANAAKSNQTSGCGKDFSRFSKTITGRDETSKHRYLVPSGVKKALGLADDEYAELFAQVQKYKYASQLDNIPEITIGNKTFTGTQVKTAILEADDLMMNNDISVWYSKHNEANLYSPKVNAVIAKVDSLDEVPQELLDFAQAHNLPIYLLGE